MSMELTVWAVAVNNGDGSGAVKVYATEPDAEAADIYEAMNEGFTDSVTKLVLKFDDDGLLLNPSKIGDIFSE